jgi:hypothetical protein
MINSELATSAAQELGLQDVRFLIRGDNKVAIEARRNGSTGNRPSNDAITRILSFSAVHGVRAEPHYVNIEDLADGPSGSALSVYLSTVVLVPFSCLMTPSSNGPLNKTRLYAHHDYVRKFQRDSFRKNRRQHHPQV